jgi:hypothetical protein
MEVEIRFKIDLTEREQERFDTLQRRSDRNPNRYAKALLLAMLNSSAYAVDSSHIGIVRRDDNGSS